MNRNAPRRFYAHHRGTGSGILDRNAAVEAGFDPVVDVTLAGDVVRRHAIVRQVDDHIVPAAPAQLVCVICKRLSDAFDVIQQPDLTAHELGNPNRHRIRAVSRAANIEECLHRQYGINRNTTNPAFLPRLLQMASKVSALESLRVLALPDMRVALWIKLEIEPTLLLQNGRKPRIVAPVRFHNHCIVWLLLPQKLIDGVLLPAWVPVGPQF